MNNENERPHKRTMTADKTNTKAQRAWYTQTFCSDACLGSGPRALECDPSQQPKIHAEDKGKSMALDAGEPLLCDRPIGQHAAVPCTLSLVDKRFSYEPAYRRVVQIWRPREVLNLADAKSGYFATCWDVPNRATHNVHVNAPSNCLRSAKRFSAALDLGYHCDLH
jgi:hypothetical protein